MNDALTDHAADARLVDDAITGHRGRQRELVRRLTPVVRRRAGRALARRLDLSKGRDLSQELDDVVQDVFVTLFKDRARQLRRWDPSRGMGLDGFVGMCAEQRVGMMLRRHRTNPWSEDPVEAVELLPRRPVERRDPERVVGSRRALESLVERVGGELTPTGRTFFELLVLRQLDVDEAARVAGCTRGTVYNWRTRLNRVIAAAAA